MSYGDYAFVVDLTRRYVAIVSAESRDEALAELEACGTDAELIEVCDGPDWRIQADEDPARYDDLHALRQYRFKLGGEVEFIR